MLFTHTKNVNYPLYLKKNNNKKKETETYNEYNNLDMVQKA